MSELKVMLSQQCTGCYGSGRSVRYPYNECRSCGGKGHLIERRTLAEMAQLLRAAEKDSDGSKDPGQR